CSTTRLMPTPSSTASFTTPIASIWPARASDAGAPDRSQGIDHQPATLPNIYCQQSARQPGDIISYRRATSSRNKRATSSESANAARGLTHAQKETLRREVEAGKKRHEIFDYHRIRELREELFGASDETLR